MVLVRTVSGAGLASGCGSGEDLRAGKRGIRVRVSLRQEPRRVFSVRWACLGRTRVRLTARFWGKDKDWVRVRGRVRVRVR